MKDFDVIIIGSGIGGLISAGLIASKGLKPLVIEAHRSPGGYISSFRRRDFIFDSAVDCISGTGPDGIIGKVLSLLNADSNIDFLKVEPVRRSIFPDFDIDVYGDLNAYIELLISFFPYEAMGIRDFFKMAGKLYDNVMANIDIFSGDYAKTFKIYPDIIESRNTTYEKILRRYIADPKLLAVLSDRCPFIGLPPSEVAALPMIMLIMSYFRLGAYRPRGGFQKLSDILVEGIRNKCGTVILGNAVKKIIFNSSSCQGVICKNGDEYTARHLISNADLTGTFSNLLGGEYIEAANKMLTDPGVSTSFFIVYGAVRGEFDGPSSIGCFPSYDFQYFFRHGSEFRDDNTVGVTIASIEDRGRAPEGCHTIVLHEMVKGGSEITDREKCADMLVKRVEKIIPDLKGRIEVVDTAAPSTLQQYTGNHLGAAFGWNQLPGNYTFNGHGLENLYIAGHWSEMGGGVLAAAYSGAKAASDIFEKEGITIDA
ncbi:MAG: NAD(P)/FAD-dependent oxidoreductase [Nitrospirota bacterium]